MNFSSPPSISILRLFALSLLSACTPASTQQCPVQADQKSSFMAAAEHFPLSIRADSGWSEDERIALEQAVSRWNDLARAQMSTEAFEISYVSLKALPGEKAIQGCDLEQTGSRELRIHRAATDMQWRKLGFASSTPAVTVRCHRGEQLTKQAILVNPSLVHSRQVMSVFLHELGHSIGLDHSCQMDRSSPSYRGCAGLEDDHPYVRAVMFPTLRVRLPFFDSFSSVSAPIEVKESLGTNDITRAGCIFGR